MKIAKRALVIIMALALVGCMSAMAFAAGSYTLVASDMDDDGFVAFTLTLVGGAGTKSDDLSFTYDASILKYDSSEEGADAAQMGDVNGNSIMLQDNGTAAGSLKFSYLFQEDLSADNLKAKRGKTVNIDPNNFQIVTFWFEVIDKNAASATLSGAGASATASIGGTPVEPPVESTTAKPLPSTTQKREEITQKQPEVTTKKAPEVITTKKAPENTTKAPESVTAPNSGNKPSNTTPSNTTPTNPTVRPNPNTGNVPTGDNMALAAAFGIVAIAGAAFVITKKRK